MKINPTMNRAKMTFTINNELQKIYKEYKIFINNDNLPQFFTNTFNAFEKHTSTEAFIRYEGNRYVFHIEQDKLILCPETIKSLAFHEFTHIWDDCTFLQELPYNERKRLTRWFTEYHATQLEMMCACEFGSLESTKSLNNDTIIYKDNYPKRLKEYIDSSYKGFIATIYTYIKDDCPPQNAVKIVLHSVYQQSECDFFKRYYNSFEYDKYQNACKVICGEPFIELAHSFLDNNSTKDVQYFKYHNSLSTDIGMYIFKNQATIRDYITKEMQNI